MDELRDKVKSWIEGQGFPLEMQVADAFLKEGFLTIQAEYYNDPDTSLSREIDVVASAQADYGDWLIRLNIVIECKVAKDKPWILLTSEMAGLYPYAQVAQQAATHAARTLLLEAGKLDAYQNLALFRAPDRAAYGVLQAFNSGNDLAYTAIMSAAKAAAALISERNDGEQGTTFAEIMIPSVVIDGRLFECHLGRGGQLEIEEVQAGTLVWRNPVAGPHTMVRVLTLPFLRTFVERAEQAAKLILSEDGLAQFIPSAKLKMKATRTVASLKLD